MRRAKRTDENHAEEYMNESWKEVEIFGYMVSNFGRVKSLKRVIFCSDGSKQSRDGRILKLNRIGLGYMDVQLGRNKHYLVHRLVAKAFCDGYFDGAQVNHIDGNRENNLAVNLEWCTSSENHLHAIHVLNRKNVKQFGRDNAKSKRVRCIECTTGKVLYEFCGAREAARKLGINYQVITSSARGENIKPTKLMWKYF